MATRYLPLIIAVLALGCLSTSSAKAEETPRVTLSAPVEAQLRHYRDQAEAELRNNILAFWMRHTVDRERGGFYGEISNELQVKKNAVRGSLLTSRILWTFSAAYRRYQDSAYLEMAKWAYSDLIGRFWDESYGGVFWSASAEGKPLNQNKQIYGQVFALYALTEYHQATKDPLALEKAITIFRLIEKHAKDAKNGGYFEVCSREWKLERDVKRSSLEPYGAKSQNTHLHVMEAYTNLLRAWPQPEIREAHRELLTVMLERILNPSTHHLTLFMTETWSPTTDEISFGHDIEASWLLTEAAEVLGDPALLKRVKVVALAVARATLAEGVDSDGSLLYEANPRGITKADREWWPQAEAVVGFFNAYQLSGDETYRKAAFKVWDYIDTHLVDKKHGEWFRAVSRQGAVSRQPKVSLWKCPYHNGRSCLELVRRIEEMLPAAGK